MAAWTLQSGIVIIYELSSRPRYVNLRARARVHIQQQIGMSSKLHYEIRIKRGRVYTIRLDFCPRNVTRGELRRSPLLHLEIDFSSSLHLWKLSSRFIPNNGNIRVSGNIHATFITRLIERNIFFNRGKWKESFINSVIISRRFYLIILIEKVFYRWNGFSFFLDDKSSVRERIDGSIDDYSNRYLIAQGNRPFHIYHREQWSTIDTDNTPFQNKFSFEIK